MTGGAALALTDDLVDAALGSPHSHDSADHPACAIGDRGDRLLETQRLRGRPFKTSISIKIGATAAASVPRLQSVLNGPTDTVPRSSEGKVPTTSSQAPRFVLQPDPVVFCQKPRAIS
jgi:hypothetical protein